MAFQVSPGVVTKEIDLTNIVPAVASSIGAIAGTFQKGPINQIISVGSEEELKSVFGEPNNTNFEDWFTAANFLQYGNALKVVRVDTEILNSSSNGSGLLIRNKDEYELTHEGTDSSSNAWIARSAGSWGNSIGISVCANKESFSQDNVTTLNQTGTPPAIGEKSVIVTDSSVFSEGDIISFGTQSYMYQIESINSGTETLSITLLDDVNSNGLQEALTGDESVNRKWKFYDMFDNPPESSVWGNTNGVSNDELHVVLYDIDGDITGYKSSSPGQRQSSIFEKYEYMSKHPKAKTPQGGSNYYRKIISQFSRNVYALGHPSGSTDWGTAANTYSEANNLPINYTLGGGTDNYTPSLSQIKTSYDLFKDSESVDINLLMAGKVLSSDAKAYAISLIELAEYRKDVVVFLSPEREDVVGISDSGEQTRNVKNFFEQLPSTSYAVFDSGYKYMYDSYSDVYRFVPLNGDIAGLCAFTDSVADTWFSPAGYNRGAIRGAVKLAFNPNKSQRDILYPARINPVISQPGQGTILFGDKTALTRPSAFDRINVRRLFITLEKAISTAAKFQLFEINDSFTRSQFKNIIEPFLRDIQGRRGITDFLVKCDGTNNTPEIVDRNEFLAEIFIKPARSINFISLNFIAAKSGVAFSEIGG